jgi:hypothetical protein
LSDLSELELDDELDEELDDDELDDELEELLLLDELRDDDLDVTTTFLEVPRSGDCLSLFIGDTER